MAVDVGTRQPAWWIHPPNKATLPSLSTHEAALALGIGIDGSLSHDSDLGRIT